jgi:hypothetical protein
MLIKATGIVGAQNQFYIIYLTKILKGRVKFIYSAPDRLETKKFKENVLNNSVAKIRNNWTETVSNTKSVCSGAKCQRKTFFFLDTSISRPTPMLCPTITSARLARLQSRHAATSNSFP